jgi:hypothetical protein
VQSPLSALLARAIDVQTRVRLAGLLLLVSTSFLATVLDLTTVLRHPPRDLQDPVRQHEDRLNRAREFLPARGVIGYVSDREGIEHVRRFYMTQYALAPLLVVRDSRRALILGDFTRPSNVGHETAGLRVLTDLGDGLVLLTPAKP